MNDTVWFDEIQQFNAALQEYTRQALAKRELERRVARWDAMGLLIVR